ncbi:MAG: FHA domain-containing protein [Chromatiales bacterium]|nr:MAG: FHA domain-containing protein [Chromatiales bacterium]
MEHERHSAFIQYPSQQEAFSFLEGVLADSKGLGLLHGPDVAGKSELIEQIAQKMRERAAVAVVDGTHLKPTAFLNAMLTQFGYELELSSVDELLNMINVFAVQQAQSRDAPVLVLEHFNHMLPSALGVLCKLAQLTVQKRFAIRIILVGDRYFRRVIDSPRMLPISIRLTGAFEMQPLTARESLIYLFARLKANGVRNPDSAISRDITESLHMATGGWPGNLDCIADAVLKKRNEFPVGTETFSELESNELFSTFEKVREEEHVPVLDDFVEPEPPQLIISHNGEVVQEASVAAMRTIIGRSDLSDIVIENQYISKQHAMLVQSEGSLFLVDLKSRNGSYVNSKKVSSQILRNNDIIALGDFRIKVVLPASFTMTSDFGLEEADTTKMMTIEDARRARKDEHLRRPAEEQKWKS